MSMHGKTDSEVTSLTASSPTRSPPRRPVYYVQSPSRDSHDGEKTTNSFHSTPVLSPSGSPGRQSRNSSSTRYSGSLRPGSRKGSQHQHQDHRKGEKGFAAIEEEGLYDEGGRKGIIPRRCYFLAFVVGFFVLFTFFALVLWGAARPQKPVITMRSIAFDQFVVNAGADASGVATEMVTLNATVKFNFRNRGTFFGVHVSSTIVDLAYTELTLATGSIKKFYQSRKGQRIVSVNVRGVGVPLYGGSVNWSSENGKLTAPVPLNLNFTVKAKAYVLGKLVKPKFYKKVSCAIVYKPSKVVNAPISPVSLKNSCTVE